MTVCAKVLRAFSAPDSQHVILGGPGIENLGALKGTDLR